MDRNLKQDQYSETSAYSRNLFHLNKQQYATPLIPDMFGYLSKIGKTLKLLEKRWYLLHSNFLYVLKRNRYETRHVILL